MYLLMAIIADADKVVHVLDELYQSGIKGATVIDSTGMAHLVSEKIPIFSQYGHLGVERFNKTLLLVIKDEKQVDKAVEVIEGVVGDLSLPETGIICVIPVLYALGIN